MKNCPICGAEVDDRVDVCPNCGTELSSPQTETEKGNKQNNSDSGRPGIGKRVIFAVLAVCCILALFLFRRNGDSSRESAESSTEASQPLAETPEPSAEMSASAQETPESSSEASTPAQETPESTAEAVPESSAQKEEVTAPQQREVDRELMNTAYAEVLLDHRKEILSYVNNLGGSFDGLNQAQVALYDFNGDGVDELLFVAQTNQGRDLINTNTYDLYVYAFDGYKAVPVLQKEVFIEAGAGSDYFVAATSDHNLLLIRTHYAETRKTEARKFGLNKTDLTTVYSFDASLSPEGQDAFTLVENGAGSSQVSGQVIAQKVSELVEECKAVLLCNFAYRDAENYSVEDKPPNAMTYARTLSALGYDLTPETEPDQYYFYGGHTYAFYNAKDLDLNSYAAVADFCKKQNGHLAVINNAGENEYLFERVKENFVKTAFFGYSDENEEGNWVWAEGSSTYTNWTVGGDWNLPDNGSEWGGNEDYAEFNYERGKEDWVPCDGTWNDAPFRDNTDVFICEWDFEI